MDIGFKNIVPWTCVKERLQKYMARCGVASRRKCEELIVSGRVSVNGEIVRHLGFKIDPEKDIVTLDGKVLRPEKMVYYAVNKPTGYISSNVMEKGKPRVIDLLPKKGRIFTVGRLDINSSGLILVTNDGNFAYRMSHPRFAPEKEYHVLIKGKLTKKDVGALQNGIVLEDGKTAPAKVSVLWERDGKSMVSITVKQGWYRMVRRMFMAIGKEVISLKRVRIGKLTLKGIEKEGSWRELSEKEIKMLIK
jgi:23S rRNA pseudouridine2605 synthase